jgi:hypothetical protein
MHILKDFKGIILDNILKDKDRLEFNFLYFDLTLKPMISSYAISKIQKTSYTGKIAIITFNVSKKQSYYPFHSAMESGVNDMVKFFYLV